MNRPKRKSHAKIPPEMHERVAEWCAKANDTDGDGKPIPRTGGLAFAQAQCATDGLKVSLDTLSRFFSWWQLEQDLSISFEREQQVLEKTGDVKLARAAGETLLMRLGLASQNPELIQAAAKVHDSRRNLDLQEASGKTKAAQKKRSLDQKDEQIALERVRLDALLNSAAEKMLDAAMRAKADEINASGASRAEKIAAMRAAAFADVDELQKSGGVQLPE